MTWLNVVDSAVKIGLGALIAGVSFLFLSRSQHYRDLSRAKVDREFEILKTVAERTERFTQAALHYWSLVSEAHAVGRGMNQVGGTASQDFSEIKNSLFDTFHDLTSSEAQLMLLGKYDAQVALRAYGDVVGLFRRATANDSQFMSEPDIEKWREKILTARDRLMSELHLCYQQLGP